MTNSIAQNLENVLRRVADAALRAGRSPEEVALVAVTKRRSPDQIRALVAAGQRVLGENRVQEALEKIDLFEREATKIPSEEGGESRADAPLEWHLIGHLQTNKAKKVVGKTALIHGVDSLRLAEALQRAAQAADVTVDLLLQLNVSGEESKFGLTPEEGEAVARELAPLDRLRCRGLTTMAPWEPDPETTRPVFRALREVRDRLREKSHDHLDLRHLSMGMSNDFEVAVEEGATLVRVGTALFE